MAITRVGNIHPLILLLLVACIASVVQAQDDGGHPILQIHGGGPSGHISAVRFSPDGNFLYAGGWDKAVWVWRRIDGQFRLDLDATFRVPIGPGLQGAINSIAISPDGQWLAVAGMGLFQGAAGFRDFGQMVPVSAMDQSMRRDQGTIHIYHTKTRSFFQLRGHEGEVVALAFAQGSGPPVLASAAREWDSAAGRHAGCVRLWSLQRHRQISQLNALPVPDGPPGMVVQRGGSRDSQVHVSLAWWAQGEGSGMRFWDVAQNQAHATYEPDYSRSLLMAGTQQISASFWKPEPTQPLKAVLRFWTKNGGLVSEDVRRRIDLVGTGENFIPTSLAVVRKNVLAISELGLVRNALRADVARLRFVQLTGNHPAPALRTLKLWDASDTPRLPIMEASRDGNFLAVGGSPRGGVMVLRTARLLGESTETTVPAVQELRLLASRFEQVSFVSKAGGLGLRLGRSAPPGGDKFDGVFAFDTRKLVVKSLDEWEDASAENSSGSATPGPRPSARTARQTVELNDGEHSVTVRLQPDNIFSRAALVKAGSQSIWAVASARAGQPLLQLYDGRSGRPIRELTGHEQRIRNLVFSRDGSWLASIEDGPQICVWSLADLDDARDDGSLPGVVVVEGDRPGSLKVMDAGETSELAVGDVLLGYLADGSLRTWPTIRSFHDTWWAIRPGDQLTVRIVRGIESRDVVLTAEPGIDERKPIFSLLLIPDPTADEQRSWLAWSPLGAFDSSDRQIENLVGWHFNGVNGRPSVYSALQNYRSQYYRPFLVRELIRTRKIPPRPRPSEPDISLWIPDAELDHSGQANHIVRDANPSAIVSLDATFPLDLIDTVMVQLNGNPNGEFQLQADRTWKASLENLSNAQVHRLRSVVRTSESPPREFAAELSFRFERDGSPTTVRAPLPMPTILPLKKSGRRLSDSQVNVEVELDRALKQGESIKFSVNDQESETPVEIVPGPGKTAIAKTTVKLDVAKENLVRAEIRDDSNRLRSAPLIVAPAPPIVKRINRTLIPDTSFESWALEVENASPSSSVFLDQLELSRSDYEIRDMDNGASEVLINQISPPRKEFQVKIDHGPPIEIAGVTYRSTPPEVKLLGPPTVPLSRTDSHTIEFFIRSASPIDRVDIYNNGNIVHRESSLTMQKDSQGQFFVKQAVEVKLQPGLSTIEVLARNSQGEGSDTLGITRPTHPVSVTVDGFALSSEAPISLKPELGSNGRLTFKEPLPKGDVILSGSVRWEDASDRKHLINRSFVHIWVNGFQQPSVRLMAARPGNQHRSFFSPIVLNQDKANLIEIELSASEIVGHSERFYVDCKTPIANRRLHLLVVSVDESNDQSDALVDSAIEAFNGWRTVKAGQGQLRDRAQFATPAFDKGFVYGPLTASTLSRRNLRSTILFIARQIETLNRKSPGTDVTLIYYRGAELINKVDGFYLTTAPTDEQDPGFGMIIKDPVNLEQFAVSSDQLNGLVERNPGAYVLLLDVARATIGDLDEANWPNDSRAAMLRYAWLAGLRVPEAARLLVGLRAALPNALSLNQVYQRLEDNHQQLRKRFPQATRFRGYLPPILQDLAMSKRNPPLPAVRP